MAPVALVVEDEHDLARLVEVGLRRAQLDVRVTHDGEAALAAAALEPPDVVVLDLGLPGVDGYQVCRALRAGPRTRRTGIVMMTVGGLGADRVEGFDAGADDYVVKPFVLRELVARTLAQVTSAGPAVGHDVLIAGVLRFDRAAREVTVAGAVVDLRPIERHVLEALLTQPTRIFSRRELLATVWGVRSGVDERVVDATIRRLCDALGPAAELIELRAGLGYRLRRVDA